jgi:4-hydroxyphenylpyruvate dioxygenase
VKGFRFNLIKSNKCGKFEQFLLNSNSMNLLITSIDEKGEKLNNRQLQSSENLFNSLKIIEKNDQKLFDLISKKRNTVFNAAFQVRDLDRILFNCKKNDVKVIKEKFRVNDESKYNEHVDCAIINSCVPGVIHTLVDMNSYSGKFLPGYDVSIKSSSSQMATHFDHLTYATYQDTSKSIIDWYKRVFNMQYFHINREEHDGLIVKTGESGMNIKAINYWLCAETGVKLNKQKLGNDFKFVISEPLGNKESNKSSKNQNQISIFLQENDGPGIQHIGLHTPNIIESVVNSKKHNSEIKYYVTPDSYYESKEKQVEINNCGLDLKLLKENHILLDSEFVEEKSEDGQGHKELKYELSNDQKSYLLQVFTQPVFEKNTLFLELIQRVGDAQGFGAANIKALWNAVQLEMDKIKNVKNKQVLGK